MLKQIDVKFELCKSHLILLGQMAAIALEKMQHQDSQLTIFIDRLSGPLGAG